MSLRSRVSALVGLVLLVSLAIYMAFAWNTARSDLAAELDAARGGGVQTVRSAFEDLPRSDHPARDLEQLVATFDGNRHLRATVLDRFGTVRLASAAALPRNPAPHWFASSLHPDREPVIIAVPVSEGGVMSLRPEPANDTAALWAATSSAVSLFAVAAIAALALIYWVIGRALTPLSDLSHGLAAIGAGEHREQVHEAGPPELLSLQRGFNDMARRLAETDARNRALEAQMLTIQDEERAEIARDLHDEIGPHLFAVSLDAEMIGRSVGEGQTQLVAEQVRSIQGAVSFMQRQVRELIARLRPTRAAELGLEAALRDLVTSWQARQPSVRFDTALDAADALVPEPLRDVIYRVVQEGVANALRHAETTALSVAVVRNGGGIVVKVANSGRVRQIAGDHPGLGLVSMRERVHAAGGVLRIERAIPGWTISARFDLQDRWPLV